MHFRIHLPRSINLPGSIDVLLAAGLRLAENLTLILSQTQELPDNYR